MIASDPTLGRFGMTARLFNLVSNMPKDQQLILLKQLAGARVTARLYKLIVDLTAEQQVLLLEQMGESAPLEMPVKTVSIEESDASMREKPRRPCLINATYRVQDQKFESYILDISIGGVFIETGAKFPVGKELLLKFSLPGHPQPFSLRGKVVWQNAKGFGLEFENVSDFQTDLLNAFVTQNE